jgi:regulator of RNase E activity RraA
VPGRLNHPISVGGVSVKPGDLVIGDADGVVVVEREQVAALLSLAEEKLAAETRRIADIEGRRQLRPGWLDGALRAAGVLREGETL